MSVQRNPKKVFKFIHLKQGTTRISGKMHDEDITYESAEDIVNAFARVFSDIQGAASKSGYRELTWQLVFIL